VKKYFLITLCLANVGVSLAAAREAYVKNNQALYYHSLVDTLKNARAFMQDDLAVCKSMLGPTQRRSFVGD
jgi:hypothetical protein